MVWYIRDLAFHFVEALVFVVWREHSVGQTMTSGGRAEVQDACIFALYPPLISIALLSKVQRLHNLCCTVPFFTLFSSSAHSLSVSHQQNISILVHLQFNTSRNRNTHTHPREAKGSLYFSSLHTLCSLMLLLNRFSIRKDSIISFFHSE